MPKPLIIPIALSVRKDSLRKSSLLKIFEICNSTNGIFDPIKASRIEIDVWVKAPAFIRIPWILFTDSWILSTISPSWLLWKHSRLILFSWETLGKSF